MKARAADGPFAVPRSNMIQHAFCRLYTLEVHIPPPSLMRVPMRV